MSSELTAGGPIGVCISIQNGAYEIKILTTPHLGRVYSIPIGGSLCGNSDNYSFTPRNGSVGCSYPYILRPIWKQCTRGNFTPFVQIRYIRLTKKNLLN